MAKGLLIENSNILLFYCIGSVLIHVHYNIIMVQYWNTCNICYANQTKMQKTFIYSKSILYFNNVNQSMTKT